MKKIKLAHQYNITYAITFIAILVVLNLVYYKAKEQSHINNQQKLCEFIVTSFSSGLEYGLTFGNKGDLEQTIFPLQNNPDIAFVNVVDNQATVMAQVDNRTLIGIAKYIKLQTFNRDIVHRISSGLPSTLPSELLEDAAIDSRRLGQIQIATTPFKYSRKYGGITLLLFNLAVIIPMLLFWVYLKLRQTQQSRAVDKIINTLNESENYHEFSNKLQTKEGSKLLLAAEQQVIKAQNMRHKLNMLKTEVQKARLDASAELHEFIGFITQQDFNKSINNLMMFYNIIKQPVDQERHAIWCRDLLAQTVVELSGEAKEQNTLIQDSFSGNRMNSQIHVDEKSFKQMLRLILQQLIKICSNHTLAIHFDLRQEYQDTANLRISFKSEAEPFLEAVEKQSLFEFREDLPVTMYSNNIQLISSKHLLKKFGGEYLYLSDEIRLEMPLMTLEKPDKKVQPEPITPLGIDLNVLVYDSDPIDKMVLIGYLTKLGADVDKATTKQVVLQKLRHDSFDAILVNSDFIEEDEAFSFSHFMEELELLENQPSIIIVSRDLSVTESEVFQKLESAQFIAKPVDPKKLGVLLGSL